MITLQYYIRCCEYLNIPSVVSKFDIWDTLNMLSVTIDSDKVLDANIKHSILTCVTNAHKKYNNTLIEKKYVKDIDWLTDVSLDSRVGVKALH